MRWHRDIKKKKPIENNHATNTDGLINEKIYVGDGLKILVIHKMRKHNTLNIHYEVKVWVGCGL